MLSILAVVFAISVTVAQPSHAQAIFKCVNDQGKIVLSDTRCGYDAKTIKIRQGNALDTAKIGSEGAASGELSNAPSRASYAQGQVLSQASDQSKRLADECARGIKRSCSAIRSIGVENLGNADQGQKDRLQSECARGFKESCKSLRTLNGEKGPTVCRTDGTLSSNYAGGANFQGRTVCREKP